MKRILSNCLIIVLLFLFSSISHAQTTMERLPGPVQTQPSRPLPLPLPRPLPSGKPYSFALTAPISLMPGSFQGGQRLFLNVRLWNTGTQLLKQGTGTPLLYITGSCNATGTTASTQGFSSVLWRSTLQPLQYEDISLLGGDPWWSYPEASYRVNCNLNLMRKEGDRFVENMHSVSTSWTLANPTGGPVDIRVSAAVRSGAMPLTNQDEITVIATLTSEGGWNYRDPFNLECALSQGSTIVAQRAVTVQGAKHGFPQSFPFNFGKLPQGVYGADCSVHANDKDRTNNTARTTVSVRAAN